MAGIMQHTEQVALPIKVDKSRKERGGLMKVWASGRERLVQIHAVHEFSR